MQKTKNNEMKNKRTMKKAKDAKNKNIRKTIN